MNKLFVLIALCCIKTVCLAQKIKDNKRVPEQAKISEAKDYTVMPYNRLIHSAGKVITYGDPAEENHSLDIAVLPDKKNLVLEDRYGIAVINSSSNKIISNWRFTKDPEWKSMISTYSGITSFVYQNKTYIAWGAAARGGNQSAVMIAEWEKERITTVSGIRLQNIEPAEKALPNQVIANIENDELFLYVVLNGNNQLIKIKFKDRSRVWSAATGVAPYGICIVGTKAYVTNWAGPLVTDTSLENAGTPWGAAYTNPATGATRLGSLSVFEIATGSFVQELPLGLHPNAIIKSNNGSLLYVANGNSDYISVIDVNKSVVTDSITTGLFAGQQGYFGSSPNALGLDASGSRLYVSNGMDNAVAVIQLGNKGSNPKYHTAKILGYIPTEAYPAGLTLLNNHLFVCNLEAKGAAVLSPNDDALVDKLGKPLIAYSIHKELASVSNIPLPNTRQLTDFSLAVKKYNLFYRTASLMGAPRKNILPKPVPERIGEPSVFKHVIYIIKENKTYDQVFGDIAKAWGDQRLCVYGENITPNQHQLATRFCLLDNYFASGKSSAEGHQWTDAAMVSDYIEKNVRAWFRSYPHRQEDALVYNKKGFIWNNALDHGKTVRVYGEACYTHYDEKLKWSDIYRKYQNHEPSNYYNTSTIARLRPILSPHYPDCDNINFTDQLRADVFIEEWKQYELENNLPDLMVLSLPNDHSAGMSEHFPSSRAMVADNDLALGRIVETISKSRYWDSTVIFVTEDDSQSGWDHISSYRTIAQVISAYSQNNRIIHTQYNQTSMVRTIEQILGIPPMNVIDATALPMFDCFGTSKQTHPYSAIPNNIPLDEMNKTAASLKGKARTYALLSASSAFKELDGGNDKLMNRILWFSAKGEEKYPAQKNSPETGSPIFRAI